MTVKITSYVDNESLIEVFTLTLTDDRGEIKTKRKGIGYYVQSAGEFVKLVDPSEHYFKKFKGYAVPSALLEEILQRNIKRIKIIERDKSGTVVRRLISTPDDWVEFGKSVKFEGFEKQVVLPCRCMKVNDGEHTQEYIEYMDGQATLNGVK